jgi:predicted Zn-dependent protease
MPVPRLLVSVLAVVLMAWFVLGARQARELDQATAIAQASSVSAAQARHADQLLGSAATLNPDREVDLTRAAVALDRNDIKQVRTIIERVTRAEPENIVAWDLLVQASQGDRRLLARAYLMLTRLQPPLSTHH